MTILEEIWDFFYGIKQDILNKTGGRGFYDLFEIDLAAARTDKVYRFRGDQLIITDCDNQAYLRLNDKRNDLIDLNVIRQIHSPFKEFYVTNVASSGNLKILAGSDGMFICSNPELIDILRCSYGNLPIDITANTLGNIPIDITANTLGNIDVDLNAQSMGDLDINLNANSIGNLPIDITANTLGNLPIDIANNTIGNLPIDITANTLGNLPIVIAANTLGNLPIDIVANTLGNIPITIAANTLGNLPIDITANTLGNIPVDIVASTIGNVNVDLNAQSLGDINIDLNAQTIDRVLIREHEGGIESSSDASFSAGINETIDLVSDTGKGALCWVLYYLNASSLCGRSRPIIEIDGTVLEPTFNWDQAAAWGYDTSHRPYMISLHTGSSNAIAGGYYFEKPLIFDTSLKIQIKGGSTAVTGEAYWFYQKI